VWQGEVSCVVAEVVDLVWRVGHTHPPLLELPKRHGGGPSRDQTGPASLGRRLSARLSRSACAVGQAEGVFSGEPPPRRWRRGRRKPGGRRSPLEWRTSAAPPGS